MDAIKKALEYGGLNETVLSHVNVSATLYFVRFEETNQSFGFKILFEVEEPEFVCKPLHVGDLTYRYVWLVFIPLKPMPSFGMCLVDAATGEIIPSRAREAIVIDNS